MLAALILVFLEKLLHIEKKMGCPTLLTAGQPHAKEHHNSTSAQNIPACVRREFICILAEIIDGWQSLKMLRRTTPYSSFQLAMMGTGRQHETTTRTSRYESSWDGSGGLRTTSRDGCQYCRHRNGYPCPVF